MYRKKPRDSNLMCTLNFITCTAGRTTTDEELEQMIEQGNPAVFTQGVSGIYYYQFPSLFSCTFLRTVVVNILFVYYASVPLLLLLLFLTCCSPILFQFFVVVVIA